MSEVKDGIFVIVFKKNPQRYLIVKNTRTEQFSFVGGALKSNESFDQAMKRELKEEVGINVALLKRTGIFHEFEYDDGVKSRQKVYIVEVRPDARIERGDVLEALWVSEDDLKMYFGTERPGIINTFNKVKNLIY